MEESKKRSKMSKSLKNEEEKVIKEQDQGGEQIKLYYFDAYGRAEMIRIYLTYMQVAFEDIRMDWFAFPETKKLPQYKIFEFG